MKYKSQIWPNQSACQLLFQSENGNIKNMHKTLQVGGGRASFSIQIYPIFTLQDTKIDDL